jgi:murein L,D-transpeptidase YcbB/YkuD
MRQGPDPRVFAVTRSLFLSVAAAILVSVAPLAGAAVPSADRLPTAAAVEVFYEGRGEPLWLSSPAAIEALLRELRFAPVDGFQQGPDLAGAIERALGDAQRGIPGAGREAEKLMSNAFVLYVQALRSPGETGMIYADPALSPRVPTPAQVLRSAARAPDLAWHVADTVGINPIYAGLRAAAAEDMRFLGTPSRALQASLGRARMLPSEGRWVLVDIAAQELRMMEGGEVVDRMKVVVGRPDQKTPLMAGTLRQVTFNPYWNVPVDLAAKSIAPSVRRMGVGWFKSRGYEVLSGWELDARVLDPATVDWRAVEEGRIEARVRQKPSPSNMMGDMKFEFPNELGIYLHDTPARARFDAAERAFSAGCVRLEDAARLGRWLLGREPVPSSDKPEYQVALGEGVPVFLTYLTVRPNSDGTLAYAPDIYGLDGAPEEMRVAASVTP